MIKRTKTKIFDTATAKLVKKTTYGEYGDPAGYELSLYQTAEGDYFLYSYGGAASAYSKESITAYSKARAQEFLKA